MNELKSGDLLYWRGKGFKAWLVRNWTHSLYSHVGMYWLNGTVPLILEADSKRGVVVRVWDIDPPQAGQHTGVAFRPQALDLMRNLNGKPYSYWTAILTVFCIAGKGSNAFICSELVVKMLEIMGWDWRGYQPTPEGTRLGVKVATGNDAEVIGG
jgi:hypothetical protein